MRSDRLAQNVLLIAVGIAQSFASIGLRQRQLNRAEIRSQRRQELRRNGNPKSHDTNAVRLWNGSHAGQRKSFTLLEQAGEWSHRGTRDFAQAGAVVRKSDCQFWEVAIV